MPEEVFRSSLSADIQRCLPQVRRSSIHHIIEPSTLRSALAATRLVLEPFQVLRRRGVYTETQSETPLRNPQIC